MRHKPGLLGDRQYGGEMKKTLFRAFLIEHDEKQPSKCSKNCSYYDGVEGATPFCEMSGEYLGHTRERTDLCLGMRSLSTDLIEENMELNSLIQKKNDTISVLENEIRMLKRARIEDVRREKALLETVAQLKAALKMEKESSNCDGCPYQYA